MDTNMIIEQTDRQTDRQTNYDALRIISTLSVIIIHVNWCYFSMKADFPSIEYKYIIESLLNIVTRFSVPCFVMISGAFNLNNIKNQDYKYFYIKTIWNIYIPFIMAIPLLLFYDMIIIIVTKGNIIVTIVNTMKGLAIGSYYNLWFLYMLFGLHFMTPFICNIKKMVSRKMYNFTALIMLMWSVISQALSSQHTGYTMGVVFAFLGYYIIGDVILNNIYLKGSSVIYFVVAILMFLVSFIVRCMGITYYISNAYSSFFSPLILIASICIFAGFKGIRIKRDLSWLSKRTYYMYLFHSAVVLLLFTLANTICERVNELAQIVIIVCLTFAISLLISIAYDGFWKRHIEWKEKWYRIASCIVNFLDN